ncbi:MAG: hypothetical protein AVDCRST_MAG86-2581, partial [uncultured Truepera sp.]
GLDRLAPARVPHPTRRTARVSPRLSRKGASGRGGLERGVFAAGTGQGAGDAEGARAHWAGQARGRRALCRQNGRPRGVLALHRWV